MKKKILRSLLPVTFLMMAIILYGCSSSGGDGSAGPATGTVTIDIADAKPLLPDDTEHVYITFEKLLLHKPGSGWISLPLAESPYTIDLFQFSDGESTEFVPPVELEAGKYTQVRIVVIDAEIVIDGDFYPLTISSNDLKTDKNFDFIVEENAALDIMIDFDLSKSIVVTGPDEYKLKPVLHIVETYAAARIKGFIAYDTFLNYGVNEAIVTLLWDKNGDSGDEPPVVGDDEEYTRIIVPISDVFGESSEFSIFWLVANEGYTVEIYFDGILTPIYTEYVGAGSLGSEDTYLLNGGEEIVKSP